jgi:hypothetical protein
MFVKLGDLSKSQSTFMVEDVGTPVYKMWDAGAKKMVSSPTPVTGMSKKYPLKTDKGDLDLGEQNFGTLLALTFKDGVSELIGRKFQVKDNGKEGLEIRYYFNLVEDDYSQPTPTEEWA